jgi:beta-phosphoglucomutase
MDVMAEDTAPPRDPALRARGFVFDLDGTIVDNIPFHMAAFSTFLARHGIPELSEEKRAAIDGKRNRDVFPIVFGHPLSDEDVLRFANEKEQLYRELSRGRLQPRPGFTRLLDRLRALGLPVAIATSAPAENVAHSLAELGLTQTFSRVARSDEVSRGKPFPDVFLRAAELIGVPPAHCLAFEDAPAGVVAARAAGMTCVAVGSTHSDEQMKSHGAAPDLEVASYEEYLAGAGQWLLG